MSPALTRRALMAGVAAIGATAAGTSASALAASVPLQSYGAAVHLDAEWSVLLDRRREAQAAWEATDAPLAEALARANAAYPERPTALRPVLSDIVNGVSRVLPDSGRERCPDGRLRGFYTADDVEALHVAGAVTVPAWDDDGEPLPDMPSPAGERRRQEIVQAHDAWMAERRAVEDAVGYTAACEAVDVAAELVCDLTAEVARFRPRTLPGLHALGVWFARQVETHNFLAMLAEAVAGFGEVST